MKFFTLTLWLTCSAICIAQESLPVPLPAAAADTQIDLNPALAGLRIPAKLITDEVSQTFRHLSPVDRVILGTHSRGTADCWGRVECRLEEQDGGAQFVCQVTGAITSNTVGVNGPATIASTAHSSYTAIKRIIFDGRQLSSHPTTVCADTRVHITGIGSTSPGLRGRIVRRVATRRSAESLPEAESITRQLTIRELQEHIDAEFSQRIGSLNQKLAQRLRILDAFSRSEYQLSIRSQPEFIDIVLTRRVPGGPDTKSQFSVLSILTPAPDPSPRTASAAQASVSESAVAVLPDFPMVDKVVLWIPQPQLQPSIQVAEWALSDVLEYVPLWLSGPLSEVKAQVDVSSPPIEVLRHENWLGLQFDPTSLAQ